MAAAMAAATYRSAEERPVGALAYYTTTRLEELRLSAGTKLSRLSEGLLCRRSGRHTGLVSAAVAAPIGRGIGTSSSGLPAP